MPKVDQRLIQCFAATFPDLNEQQIRSATPDTVTAWDSEMYFTLLGIVEEEFGIKVADEDLADLLSFEAYRKYLERRMHVIE